MIYPHLLSGCSFAGRRIGLLGGSFNPAHGGHREMSLYALKRLNLDEIWWLVSPQNPLKSTANMAPLQKRLDGARAAARHPKIAVTDLETQLGTRYTTDTLRVLLRRFPKTNFVWLMGADNWQQLPQWRRWTDIMRQIPAAVFRRDGSVAGRGRGKAANRFADAWRPLADARTLVQIPAPAWLVLDNRLNLLSATAIRRQQSKSL